MQNVVKVVKGNRWGLADRLTGKILAPVRRRFCTQNREFKYFAKCRAVKKRGKFALFDNDGKALTPRVYEDIWEVSDNMLGYLLGGLAGYMDASGHILTPPLYKALFEGEFSEGLLRVKKGKKFGFIDERGREVIPFYYRNITDFHDGVAFGNTNRDNQKWGAIDKSGQTVIPFKYKGIKRKSGFDKFDRMIMGKQDDYVLINRAGRELTPHLCIIEEFDDGGLAKVLGPCANGISEFGYGYIDANGNEVISCLYSTLDSFGGERYAICIKDGKFGIIDREGKFSLPCEYELLWMDYFSDEMTGLMTKKRYSDDDERDEIVGYLSPKGDVIALKKYEAYRRFYEGLAAVRLDELWGYIDKNGAMIIPPKYDFADGFSEGRALVKKGRKYGFIDREGNEVIPLIYDDAEQFYDGVVWAVKNGKQGYLGLDGCEVLPFVYDRVDKVVLPNYYYREIYRNNRNLPHISTLHIYDIPKKSRNYFTCAWRDEDD